MTSKHRFIRSGYETVVKIKVRNTAPKTKNIGSIVGRHARTITADK